MKKVIEIEGMHCMGCVKRVENALHEFEGAEVAVDLEGGKATVESANEIADAALTEAVEDLGFDVTAIHE